MQNELFKLERSARPLFDELKLGTNDIHRKLENFLPALRNDFTRDQYIQFLIRLLGFYIPIEEHISEFLAHGYDPFETPLRKKSPLLISDLAALGGSKDALVDIPICGAIKEIDSVPELVGVLYAVESFSLHAHMAEPRLQEHLQLGSEQIKFYNGYGEDTYEAWLKFRMAAESTVRDQEFEAAITRARITFIKMKNWIQMSVVQA